MLRLPEYRLLARVFRSPLSKCVPLKLSVSAMIPVRRPCTHPQSHSKLVFGRWDAFSIVLLLPLASQTRTSSTVSGQRLPSTSFRSSHVRSLSRIPTRARGAILASGASCRRSDVQARRFITRIAEPMSVWVFALKLAGAHILLTPFCTSHIVSPSWRIHLEHCEKQYPVCRGRLAPWASLDEGKFTQDLHGCE